MLPVATRQAGRAEEEDTTMYRRALAGMVGARGKFVERRTGVSAGRACAPASLPMQRWAQPHLERHQQQQVRVVDFGCASCIIGCMGCISEGGIKRQGLCRNRNNARCVAYSSKQ